MVRTKYEQMSTKKQLEEVRAMQARAQLVSQVRAANAASKAKRVSEQNEKPFVVTLRTVQRSGASANIVATSLAGIDLLEWDVATRLQLPTLEALRADLLKVIPEKVQLNLITELGSPVLSAEHIELIFASTNALDQTTSQPGVPQSTVTVGRDASKSDTRANHPGSRSASARSSSRETSSERIASFKARVSRLLLSSNDDGTVESKSNSAPSKSSDVAAAAVGNVAAVEGTCEHHSEEIDAHNGAQLKGTDAKSALRVDSSAKTHMYTFWAIEGRGSVSAKQPKLGGDDAERLEDEMNKMKEILDSEMRTVAARVMALESRGGAGGGGLGESGGGRDMMLTKDDLKVKSFACSMF